LCFVFEFLSLSCSRLLAIQRAYYSCFMSLSTIIMASSITFASASLLFAFSSLFLSLSPPAYVFNDYLERYFCSYKNIS
jgi:hypothetical protein